MALDLETSKVFSVRSVYKFLTAQPPTATPMPVSSLWHKDVPLKVVMFAWRLFWDRLPTKDNLFRRGVLDQNSLECVAGCGSVESSAHLFLHCNVSGSVWHLIYGWLGISAAAPQFLPDHFIHFSFLGGSGKVCQSILQVIWFATIWKIWKERNNRLFTDKTCSIPQVVDKIKSLTFMWLKARFATLPFNLHGCWLSPFTILGID